MHTVIVGNSVAGVRSALELARQSTDRVTFVVEDFWLLHPDALIKAAAGDIREEAVDIRTLFAPFPHVTVAQDTLKSIDPVRKLVVGYKKSYSYHPLILALGNSYGLFTHDTTVRATFSETYNHIAQLRSKIENELLADQHMDKTYYIVGGTIFGVRLASALAAHIAAFSQLHMVKRARISIALVEKSGRILPELSTTASRRTAAQLKKQDIQIYTGLDVINHTKQDYVIINGSKTSTDCILWAKHVSSNSFYTDHPQYFDTTAKKVLVNPYLEAYRDIYTIGDSLQAPDTSSLKTLIDSGEYIAKYLWRKHNRRPTRTYRQKYYTHYVSLSSWAYTEKLGIYMDGKPAQVAYRRMVRAQLRRIGVTNLIPIHNTKKPDI